MDEIKQVCSKIYYEINSSNIILITSECQGNIVVKTKKEDMKLYLQLQKYREDEIDFIELPYGTLGSTFNNVKSYKINAETKSLDFVYFTQEELESTAQQIQETQSISEKVSNISEYLSQDPSAIADIEDYILQKEQNKILGVV